MRYHNPTGAANAAPSPVGVLLANTGTPAAPTPAALRPYLAQFLGDPRIIELPAWLWQPILRGVILNTRPRRSARLYQRVWTDDGSPLLSILRRQAQSLADRLAGLSPGAPPLVEIGMRYGEPSISSALRRLEAAGARRLLVLPLFPQYSGTTTGAVLDAVFQELRTWRWVPEVRTVNHYHDHPGYIDALVNSVCEAQAQAGHPDRLLFSFHGIPRRYVVNGDPYLRQCHATARLVVERLGLPDPAWQVAFQSRFGPVEWLKPYTDVVLEAWGAAKVKHVQTLCPGFSADCLETLDEIAHEGRHIFQAAGGGLYSYIPALNDRPDHLDALARIVTDNLHGWLD